MTEETTNQFINDVNLLHECVQTLRHSAKRKVSQAYLAEQVAASIEQVAKNMSKVRLASE